jgi:phosphotransacetylase
MTDLTSTQDFPDCKWIDEKIKEYSIDPSELECVNKRTLQHVQEYFDRSREDVTHEDYMSIIEKEINEKNTYFLLLLKLYGELQK